MNNIISILSEWQKADNRLLEPVVTSEKSYGFVVNL